MFLFSSLKNNLLLFFKQFCAYKQKQNKITRKKWPKFLPFINLYTLYCLWEFENNIKRSFLSFSFIVGRLITFYSSFKPSRKRTPQKLTNFEIYFTYFIMGKKLYHQKTKEKNLLNLILMKKINKLFKSCFRKTFWRR